MTPAELLRHHDSGRLWPTDAARLTDVASAYQRALQVRALRLQRGELARRLLAQAAERETPLGRMRIISVEGLIGFKLQGFVNDATRTRDLDDICALLKLHRASIDIDELREYFALFNRPELLDELLGPR